MKVGDVIELEIERMSFGPAAVGRYQATEGQSGEHNKESRAMVIFVEGAAPGERVRANLTRNNKNYWEAKLVEVLSPSKDRVSPPCPVFGRCGGCQWQHLDYPAQVRAKEEILLHQLSRSTRLPSDELRSRLTSHPAAQPFNYRARLQVHGDKAGLGFFAPGSHKIVHADQCLVAHPDIQKAWSAFLAQRSLADLAKPTGQFKIEWTRTDSGQLKEAFNRKHGAFGFTQVNPEQNAVLVDLVASLAGHGDVLFDLYGGDGNLSNKLSSFFKRIVSVDSFNSGEDPTAIKGPLPPGRTSVRQSVESFLVDQRWREWDIEKIDCVVVDPPRNGLREAAGPVARLRSPRIILVSCDPSTLARDLLCFTDHYSIERIHLIDMFPQTYHLETVVQLVARNEL